MEVLIEVTVKMNLKQAREVHDSLERDNVAGNGSLEVRRALRAALEAK